MFANRNLDLPVGHRLSLEVKAYAFRSSMAEGLLTPTRMENGYRDYTRSDLDTLHKIRLLRGKEGRTA